MIVTCQTCGAAYDDARSWTICPHNPLYRGAGDVLCREHDLFNCQLCKGREHNPALNYPREDAPDAAR